jgi:DNA-binding CsgD family transcriptional regulator
MAHSDSTRQRADAHAGTIESAVSQLIQRLIENDDRLDPAVEPEEIILDIEVDGVRYLAIRCNLRAMRPARDGPETAASHTQSELCPSLSPRELEIARMVAKGYPNKTIASVLDISSWTVSSHLRRIYTKLGVTSRAAMVARLLDDGRSDQPAETKRWSADEPTWPVSRNAPLDYGAGRAESHLPTSRDAAPPQRGRW